MPHVKTKGLGQMAEQIHEKRESAFCSYGVFGERQKMWKNFG